MAEWELCKVTCEHSLENPQRAEVVFFKTWERDSYSSMQVALRALQSEAWDIIIYYTDAIPPHKEVALLQRLT